MYKFISIPFLLLIFLLASGFQNSRLKSIAKTGFNFCMSYPVSFTGQGESENGDGQLFLSKDKQAEIRTYGKLALEDVNESLSDVYASATKHLQVSYKVMKPEWFVISGLNEAVKIVYRENDQKENPLHGQ